MALSHSWASCNSSETRLTASNLSKLQQCIEPTEISRSVFDGIKLTRTLGMRYLWTDSLCVVQGDLEGLSGMSDIYRSAVVTIVPTEETGAYHERVVSYIDSFVLQQPFSIFLDWSRPNIAKPCSDRLFSPNAFSQLNVLWYKVTDCRAWLLRLAPCVKGKNAANHSVVAAPVNESRMAQEHSSKLDGLDVTEAVHMMEELYDIRHDEAGREIDQGVHQIEAGKNWEALASFVKAKERVSAFQTLTLKSWKVHAAASTNIALVYQMQHLPTMALDMAEGSLALQSRFSEGEYKSTPE